MLAEIACSTQQIPIQCHDDYKIMYTPIDSDDSRHVLG